jgi:mono/diheme cytochrome c family protein
VFVFSWLTLMRPAAASSAASVRLLIVCVAAILGAAGCRQDMHDQPSYSPLEKTPFFADGRSAREPVAGTVARGALRDDELLYTGIVGGDAATVFPFPVDAGVMARGRELFDAFCSPCHGRTGAGDGIVVRRGFTRPPDLTDQRLRDIAPGYIFNVITNGFGAMPDHGAQIRPRDRWAIIAYLRALQLSASATLAEVPPAERTRLEGLPR